MKIGQFAKKHGVTHDTIRHYIDKGLLVPNKKEGQYRFSEVDSKEITKIIELKQMHFSLSDIHRILTFQRLGGASTEFSRNQFLSILEERKEHILEELRKINQINEYLTKQIEEIKSYGHKEEHVLGFPIGATELLACPFCHKELNLSAGVLEKNMIIQANVDCDCGYSAKISNGIYIVEKDVRTKLMDGMPMPTKEEYFNKTPHEHITYQFKGMAQLIDYIMVHHKEPQYVMEISNCVGFFLLQYINYLPEQCTYILIDYDLERISNMKKNLEQYYSHKKFIFFCCDYTNLPLRKSSVDVVVDLMMSNKYEIEFKKAVTEKTTLLLKSQGIFVGKYTHWRGIQNVNSNLKELDKVREIMLDQVKTASKMKIIDSIEIFTGEKDSVEVKNRKKDEYQYIFIAKKS